MNIRINNADPKLIEDDFGNPLFRYVGIHPNDVNWLVTKIDSLKEEVDDLERGIERRDEVISNLKEKACSCILDDLDLDDN